MNHYPSSRTPQPARQPKGAPGSSGGQFAPDARSDPETVLEPPPRVAPALSFTRATEQLLTARNAVDGDPDGFGFTIDRDAYRIHAEHVAVLANPSVLEVTDPDPDYPKDAWLSEQTLQVSEAGWQLRQSIDDPACQLPGPGGAAPGGDLDEGQRAKAVGYFAGELTRDLTTEVDDLSDGGLGVLNAKVKVTAAVIADLALPVQETHWTRDRASMARDLARTGAGGVSSVVKSYTERRTVRNASLAFEAANDTLAKTRIEGGDQGTADALVARAREDLLLALAPAAGRRVAARVAEVRDAMANGPLSLRTWAESVEALTGEHRLLSEAHQAAFSHASDRTAAIRGDLEEASATLHDLHQLWEDSAPAVFYGDSSDQDD